jgi:UDPglucose--hexose-1-phosphate uridylyltransferase
MQTHLEITHRRRNALTGEWVLVFPHRAKHPWQGRVDKPDSFRMKLNDPDCYLCPGTFCDGGEHNPDYPNTFVITNDFAALLPDKNPFRDQDSLLLSKVVEGTGR